MTGFSMACYGGAINFGHIEMREEVDHVWFKVIGYMGGEQSLILGIEELECLKKGIEGMIKGLTE